MKIRKFKKSDAKEVAELIRKNDLEIAIKFYPKKVVIARMKTITPDIILKKSLDRICYIAEENKKEQKDSESKFRSHFPNKSLSNEGNFLTSLSSYPEGHKGKSQTKENKKIIGYISLSGNEIKKLFVLPKYHKKGIGKKLSDKIEKIAKNKGIKKLVLYSNYYTEEFYKKCGFKRIKIVWEKVGNLKFKQIYMEKKLNNLKVAR